MAATTLPTLLLGGDPSGHPEETYAVWDKALRAARRARAGGRPRPALPAGRRRRLGRGRRGRPGPAPTRLPPDEVRSATFRRGGAPNDDTIRLTVAQATVRFLAAQYSERDGVEQRLVPGCFGIFGHGNVAGIGQALLQAQLTGEADLPYYLAPQRAGHGARRRAATPGCATGCRRWPAPPRSAPARPTWSPARRWPRSTGSRCCCCRATCSPPGRASPVLQELEDPRADDVSVNDAFRPVSRFFDRVNRPGAAASRPLLAAMRVLTDPVETGAVTIALPQDVQAEALRLAGRRCSPSGSGTSPGPCRSPPRCSARST